MTPSFDARRDVSFLVISCDKYKDLWDPFFGCLDKYWPDCPFPVYLATNEASYPRADVSVINIGPDRDYANNLITAVSAIPTPWVILWVEDGIFTERIDSTRIIGLLESAVAAGAGYLKLTPDAPLSFDDRHGERIGEIPRGVRYRSAIGTALYRKDILLHLLVPGWSAWQLDKSERSNDIPDPFMALTVREARRPPLPIVNAVIKGRWHRPAVPFLRREGFASVLPGRDVASWRSYLYIRFFLARVALLRLLRRHWYD
ncbi:MAG: hypothetical protein ACYC1S_13710 [Gemmatimonadaceae bacterium]